MAALIFAAVAVRAQNVPPPDAPKDVLDFFRTAAEALADKDASAFLEHFDSRMPGYDVLSSQVRSLLERSELGSSIEIVADSGDEHKRTLQLDWLIRIDQNLPKRQIVTCTIEKQGRRWRITSFAPLDFLASRMGPLPDGRGSESALALTTAYRAATVRERSLCRSSARLETHAPERDCIPA
jgi:hypothetical protein